MWAATRALRGSMGLGLPGHLTVMAAELGAGRSDVLLPFGDQARRLHDEYDRVLEHDLAEGVEESVAVPE